MQPVSFHKKTSPFIIKNKGDNRIVLNMDLTFMWVQEVGGLCKGKRLCGFGKVSNSKRVVCNLYCCVVSLCSKCGI